MRDGGISHMREAKYEDSAREVEEEGVVWMLISFQPVPGTGERSRELEVGLPPR